MAKLDDKVAWVDGADGEPGRAVALLLAASGARVLVTGADERALGRCVGEIAHGGGKARHVVGSARTEDAARACVRAAVERFGSVDCAVVERADVERASLAIGNRANVVAVDASDPRGAEAVASDVAEAVATLAPR